MTLYDFKEMDEMKQAEAVWKGVPIGERKSHRHRVVLYQVHSFYAEVYFHQNSSIVCKIRPFSSTEQLWPYLKQIDLSCVL